MRRAQMGIAEVAGLVIVIAILAIAIIVLWQSSKGTTNQINATQQCEFAARLVGSRGGCFKYSVCSNENQDLPQQSPGGEWQALPGQLGCPAYPDDKADQMYCCAFIPSGYTGGTGSVLRCAGTDPDTKICDGVASDPNGKYFTESLGADGRTHRYECVVRDNKCVAQPQ